MTATRSVDDPAGRVASRSMLTYIVIRGANVAWKRRRKMNIATKVDNVSREKMLQSQ